MDIPREYKNIKDVPFSDTRFVIGNSLYERRGSKVVPLAVMNFIYFDLGGILKSQSLQDYGKKIANIDLNYGILVDNTTNNEERIESIEPRVDSLEETVSDLQITELGLTQSNSGTLLQVTNDETTKTPFVLTNGTLDFGNSDMTNLTSINGKSINTLILDSEQKDNIGSYSFVGDGTSTVDYNINYFSPSTPGTDLTITILDTAPTTKTKIHHIINADATGTLIIEHLISSENNVEQYQHSVLLPGQSVSYLRLSDDSLRFYGTNGTDKFYIRVTTPFSVSTLINIPEKYTWAWFRVNGTKIESSALRAVTGLTGVQVGASSPRDTTITLVRDYGAVHDLDPSGTVENFDYSLGSIADGTSLEVEFIVFDYQLMNWFTLVGDPPILGGLRTYIPLRLNYSGEIIVYKSSNIYTGVIIGGTIGFDTDGGFIEIDELRIRATEYGGASTDIVTLTNAYFNEDGHIIDWRCPIPFPINSNKQYTFSYYYDDAVVTGKEPWITLTLLTY